MSLSVEERKLILTKKLETIYADKPAKWWKSGNVRYELTAIAALQSKWIPDSNTTTIFKYNFRKKWYEFAFAAVIIILMLSFAYWGKAAITYEVWIAVGAILFLAIHPVFKSQNRLPKIILTEKGIWADPLDHTIPWENVVASYIKYDHRGDDANEFLVLHYYGADKDDFFSHEYLLNDLNAETCDLAAQIEFRKTKR